MYLALIYVNSFLPFISIDLKTVLKKNSNVLFEPQCPEYFLRLLPKSRLQPLIGHMICLFKKKKKEAAGKKKVWTETTEQMFLISFFLFLLFRSSQARG